MKLERTFYNSLIASMKDLVATNTLDLGQNPENSRPITSHYSFDFAQQVFYPNDPLQPGPIYFLVPRKCAIFGICCEGIPKQVNFLIDEASSINKGSNSVISYLDYYFSKYGLGETDVDLHADNCSGQNKNRFMLWYLCWRTLTNRHSTVGIHFLITGHTKFAPDWCFGLLKQKYRRTAVSCLDDLQDVVRASTVTGANIPQLVGTEDGKQIVPTREWSSFLAPYFRTLPGVKSNQHYRFDAQNPGVVYYKQYSDSVESSFQLLKRVDTLPPADRPTPVCIPPMDPARVNYLHNKIRPFVREDVQDRVCPAPRPTTSRKRTRVDSE